MKIIRGLLFWGSLSFILYKSFICFIFAFIACVLVSINSCILEKEIK